MVFDFPKDFQLYQSNINFMKTVIHVPLFRFFLILLALAPLPASALIDEDLDGMSDLWEALYSFSITDNGTLFPTQAPSADPDTIRPKNRPVPACPS